MKSQLTGTVALATEIEQTGGSALAVQADIAEWDRMIAINAQGLLYMTHTALPHLLKAAEDAFQMYRPLPWVIQRRFRPSTRR
jgi:NAD(P)-dependent dehydrogenase (short-subunit alcohol dehydrogenase family)